MPHLSDVDHEITRTHGAQQADFAAKLFDVLKSAHLIYLSMLDDGRAAMHIDAMDHTLPRYRDREFVSAPDYEVCNAFTTVSEQDTLVSNLRDALDELLEAYDAWCGDTLEEYRVWCKAEHLDWWRQLRAARVKKGAA